MGPVIARALSPRPLKALALNATVFASLAAALVAGPTPARAQACLEQIVTVQAQLKAKEPRPARPPSEPQSIGAQDDRQPTPGSLAAAGLNPPQDGALGALNAAINLQAAGDEAGCMKALNEARTLGGLN
ncbi:hypothetical protein V5F53_07665 [Xanthobacter sp. V4C-4]|uniref:hypothetical protein n=1 Tax=Xanthobacter cornucopiae TaxID=3119924 RepID=UPI00372864B0